MNSYLGTIHFMLEINNGLTAFQRYQLSSRKNKEKEPHLLANASFCYVLQWRSDTAPLELHPPTGSDGSLAYPRAES